MSSSPVKRLMALRQLKGSYPLPASVMSSLMRAVGKGGTVKVTAQGFGPTKNLKFNPQIIEHFPFPISYHSIKRAPV